MFYKRQGTIRPYKWLVVFQEGLCSKQLFGIQSDTKVPWKLERTKDLTQKTKTVFQHSGSLTQKALAVLWSFWSTSSSNSETYLFTVLEYEEEEAVVRGHDRRMWGHAELVKISFHISALCTGTLPCWRIKYPGQTFNLLLHVAYHISERNSRQNLCYKIWYTGINPR